MPRACEAPSECTGAADDRPDAGRCDVTVRGGAGGPGGPGMEAWLREMTVRALPHLPCAVERVAVVLLDDAAMADMHGRHLGEPGPTDVLTFVHAAPPAPIDVDIAVGADVARREAAARRHGVREELLLYILHGLLHAAGHDDHDADAFRAMHAEEDRILGALGLPPVFRRDEHDPGEERTR